MNRHTLLFVDDEPNILHSLQRLFRKTPHRILIAQSGSEALALIEGGESPSVIVSDQRMPEMNGAEFLSKSRDLLPDASRIILTGYSELEAAMDAINKGGVFRYVSKPWNDLDLKNTLDEAIARYELILENKELTEELQNKNALLEEWNHRLEDKVAKRTEALRLAHEQLQQKVKELQGRDRILHHILEVHTLDDTLQTVIEVICEVVGVDEIVVYLGGSVEALVAQLGKGINGQDGWQNASDLSYLKDRLAHCQIFEQAIAQKMPVNKERGQVTVGEQVYEVSAFVAIPIVKGPTCLGLVEARRHDTQAPLDENDIEMICNFTMQAAVAIQDSQLKTDLTSLDVTLDDVLNDL
jgi:CheY-like chemotaxis protein